MKLNQHLARFVSWHVQRRQACWIWKGNKDRDGYGRTRFNRRSMPAHRAIYLFLGNSIPAGAYLCHHCDVRSCCNPTHLFIGDARANALDAKKKDRHSRGERNGCSHLTDDNIRTIRSLAGKVKQTTLARRFKIRQSSIWMIQNRKQWTHVAD